MKVPAISPLRASLPRRWIAPFLAAIFAAHADSLPAITLTGSNGRSVEFHLVKSATPKGLTAQMAADGPVIGIAWDKLDLAALERDHKAIHDAYLRAKQGETVELNLEKDEATTTPAPGAAAPAPPSEGSRPAPAPPKYPGWLDAKLGDLTFMLKMPDDPVKGILFLSIGDFGRSYERVGELPAGSGSWIEFQNRFDLALMTYNLDQAGGADDPTVIGEFVYAEKGSGKLVESAIRQFAEKAKSPALAEAPIALYGTERSGAAFVYHLLHYRPERVIGAVVSKGAFYDREPTPEAARVPVLFLWGEYCNNHEIWGSANHAASVLAKAAPLHPNWTNGREFRGRGEQNPVVEYFGKKYLGEIVELRLPDGKSAPAPKTEAKGASGEAAPSANGATEEGEGGGGDGDFGLVPMDRAKGSKGNVETGEVAKLADPQAPLTAEETFLPNDAVAKLWKGLVLGELEAPPQPQPPP